MHHRLWVPTGLSNDPAIEAMAPIRLFGLLRDGVRWRVIHKVVARGQRRRGSDAGRRR